MPARSILKQRSTEPKPTLSDEQKAQAERDRRNLDIALHHANKIQAQQDFEALILSNIETLLELPSGSAFTSAETSNFVSLIAPFQPSDFDSLVEERRIDGKCGYVLCANQPRSVTLGTSAAWKLKGQGAGDYCSNDCFRKALYVKTQLSEVPAWERAPGQQPHIVLRGDDRSSIDATKLETARNRQDREANNRELALERGEQAASFRPNQVMADSIVEKANVSHKSPTLGDGTGSSYASIEGYVPMQTRKRTPELSPAAEPGDRTKVDGGVERIEDPANEEDDSWSALYENLSKR